MRAKIIAVDFDGTVIKAGGTQEEAMRMTQALIAVCIFGGKKEVEE